MRDKVPECTSFSMEGWQLPCFFFRLTVRSFQSLRIKLPGVGRDARMTRVPIDRTRLCIAMSTQPKRMGVVASFGLDFFFLAWQRLGMRCAGIPSTPVVCGRRSISGGPFLG